MHPLSDVTILDLSLKLPGPYATKLLTEAGADVVSIEPPGGDFLGDPESEEYRQTYAALNEGKRSMMVDLKDERGQAFVQAIAAEADAVVEGFSPGTAERLGVDYETLQRKNRDLVYCSLSGYGQTGPRRNEPGHDLNYQGIAGFLDPENPRPPKTPVADYAGATMLALTVLVALWGRERGGGGQYIDLAMFDVIASWNDVHRPWMESNDQPTDYDPVIGGEYPCYNTYETGDGRHLAVGAMERGFWVGLCEALDLPELVDQQFATGGQESEAYQRLQETFVTRPMDEWIDELGEDFPISAVQTTSEAITDPQVAARKRRTSDEQSSESTSAFGFPVGFDEADADPHATDQSVADAVERAGYGTTDLDNLEADGVVTERTEP